MKKVCRQVMRETKERGKKGRKETARNDRNEGRAFFVTGGH